MHFVGGDGGNRKEVARKYTIIKDGKPFFFCRVGRKTSKIGSVKKWTWYNEILLRISHENVYYDIRE